MIKSILLAVMLAFAPLAAMATDAVQPTPQVVQDLVKTIETNGMQAVVLTGTQLAAFSKLSAEAYGPNAVVPSDVVIVVIPDPRSITGAGEGEHAGDPWPVIAFTANGEHKYQAMAPRGGLETILKTIDQAA